MGHNQNKQECSLAQMLPFFQRQLKSATRCGERERASNTENESAGEKETEKEREPSERRKGRKKIIRGGKRLSELGAEREGAQGKKDRQPCISWWCPHTHSIHKTKWDGTNPINLLTLPTIQIQGFKNISSLSIDKKIKPLNLCG